MQLSALDAISSLNETINIVTGTAAQSQLPHSQPHDYG